MTEPARPRLIICRARPRSRMRRVLVLALPLLACATVPVWRSAQAHLRPAPAPIAHAATHPPIPGSITLAEMIERQRKARAEKAALRAPAAPEGDWVAQFGAFTALEPAQAMRDRLHAEQVGHGATLRIAFANGYHRVRSPGMNQDAAQALCVAAARAGTACFVRPR